MSLFDPHINSVIQNLGFEPESFYQSLLELMLLCVKDRDLHFDLKISHGPGPEGGNYAHITALVRDVKQDTLHSYSQMLNPGLDANWEHMEPLLGLVFGKLLEVLQKAVPE